MQLYVASCMQTWNELLCGVRLTLSTTAKISTHKTELCLARIFFGVKSFVRSPGESIAKAFFLLLTVEMWRLGTSCQPDIPLPRHLVLPSNCHVVLLARISKPFCGRSLRTKKEIFASFPFQIDLMSSGHASPSARRE